jgi:hypothetical protein
MKTYYVIDESIYALSEKKEKKLNTLFPPFPCIDEEMRQDRLRWIEVHGKFVAYATIENY